MYVPVSADYNVAMSKVDTALDTSDLGTTDDEEAAMLLKSKRVRR